MTNTETLPQLRDEVASTSRQGYRLVRTYRLGSDVVQIEVAVDSYEQQSFACARIMGSDRSWAPLVALPPSRWFNGRASYVSVKTSAQVLAQCEPVADELLARVEAILS